MYANYKVKWVFSFPERNLEVCLEQAIPLLVSLSLSSLDLWSRKKARMRLHKPFWGKRGCQAVIWKRGKYVKMSHKRLQSVQFDFCGGTIYAFGPSFTNKFVASSGQVWMNNETEVNAHFVSLTLLPWSCKRERFSCMHFLSPFFIFIDTLNLSTGFPSQQSQKKRELTRPSSKIYQAEGEDRWEQFISVQDRVVGGYFSSPQGFRKLLIWRVAPRDVHGRSSNLEWFSGRALLI